MRLPLTIVRTSGKYLGVIGVRLAMNSLTQLPLDCGRSFERDVYFVDADGTLQLGFGHDYPKGTRARSGGLGSTRARLPRAERGAVPSTPFACARRSSSPLRIAFLAHMACPLPLRRMLDAAIRPHCCTPRSGTEAPYRSRTPEDVSGREYATLTEP